MPIAQPAILRIKKRSDFIAAAKSGHKVVASTLVLQARPPLSAENNEDIQPIRVGFTVTRKVGNAVVRNRIRRRLKAAVDHLLQEYGRPGWDYVLIGRLRAKEETFDIILRDLRYALRKVVKQQEKTP